MTETNTTQANTENATTNNLFSFDINIGAKYNDMVFSALNAMGLVRNPEKLQAVEGKDIKLHLGLKESPKAIAGLELLTTLITGLAVQLETIDTMLEDDFTATVTVGDKTVDLMEKKEVDPEPAVDENVASAPNSSNTFIADMFIVPCSATKPKDLGWDALCDAHNAKVKKFNLSHGYLVLPEDVMVKIEVVHIDSENLSHYHIGSDNFLSHIPARQLIGVKEGGFIRTPIFKDKTLMIRANQHSYKYKNHGTFEEVLENVMPG